MWNKKKYALRFYLALTSFVLGISLWIISQNEILSIAVVGAILTAIGLCFMMFSIADNLDNERNV